MTTYAIWMTEYGSGPHGSGNYIGQEMDNSRSTNRRALERLLVQVIRDVRAGSQVITGNVRDGYRFPDEGPNRIPPAYYIAPAE